MLSRRSFSKLCGLSTIPLFTGLEAIAAPETKSVVLSRGFFPHIIMPDIHQVFTKTDKLEFPLNLVGDESGIANICPLMITTCIDYDSKYKNRTDIVDRCIEACAAGLRNKIEKEMLSLLFYAGLETGIRRPWKWEKTKWKLAKWTEGEDLKYRKFIMSPETIEDCSSGPNPSKYLLCSDLLGKDQPSQQELLTKYGQRFNGDICLRIDSSKSDSIVLTHLASLPSRIGFNTSFDFDPKTLKVTEKPFRKSGRETISLAYFCAMGILDYRSVTLFDL